MPLLPPRRTSSNSSPSNIHNSHHYSALSPAESNPSSKTTQLMTNPFIIGKLRVPSLTTTFYTQVPNKVSLTTDTTPWYSHQHYLAMHRYVRQYEPNTLVDTIIGPIQLNNRTANKENPKKEDSLPSNNPYL